MGVIDLIARLETATGPDRDLDAEIMFDLYASPVGTHGDDGGPFGYIRLDDRPSWNFGLRFSGKDRAWFSQTREVLKSETLIIERDGAFVLMNSLRIPRLTASSDAAMTLIPMGRAIRREYLPAASWPHRVWLFADAAMQLPENSGRPVLGKTEAIALCITALKASCAEMGSHRA